MNNKNPKLERNFQISPPEKLSFWFWLCFSLLQFLQQLLILKSQILIISDLIFYMNLDQELKLEKRYLIILLRCKLNCRHHWLIYLLIQAIKESHCFGKIKTLVLKIFEKMNNKLVSWKDFPMMYIMLLSMTCDQIFSCKLF